MVAKYDPHRENLYAKVRKDNLRDAQGTYIVIHVIDEWSCTWDVSKMPGPICYCMQWPQYDGKGWPS